MPKDYDKPVAHCPVCKLPIHESMISGRWLVSCNCKEAIKLCAPKNKEAEAILRKKDGVSYE